VFSIIQDPIRDRLICTVLATGRTSCTWEDTDNGGITLNGDATDLDTACGGGACYGYWATIRLRWDTTRCTQGDGNCADAGEDELCYQFVVDSDKDGSFADESFATWDCEVSTTDLEAWTAEPTTDDYKFGLSSATYSVDLYTDDVEITPAKPTW